MRPGSDYTERDHLIVALIIHIFSLFGIAIGIVTSVYLLFSHTVYYGPGPIELTGELKAMTLVFVLLEIAIYGATSEMRRLRKMLWP